MRGGFDAEQLWWWRFDRATPWLHMYSELAPAEVPALCERLYPELAELRDYFVRLLANQPTLDFDGDVANTAYAPDGELDRRRVREVGYQLLDAIGALFDLPAYPRPNGDL